MATHYYMTASYILPSCLLSCRMDCLILFYPAHFQSKKVRKQNDLPSTESLDVSSIEKASFLQGEEFSSHGMCNIHTPSIHFYKCTSTKMGEFGSQIILNFLLFLFYLGNPLHSTALDDESRFETDRWQKARTEKRTGEGRENEAQAVTETPKRPGHAVKNLKIQKGSDVQAQKTTSSIPRRTQKPPQQTGHVPISQYLKFSLLYIYYVFALNVD